MSTKKNKEVTESAALQNTEAAAVISTNGGSEAAESATATGVDKTATGYHITSPDETKYLANDLARFIRENKLFHNIQGKEYVNVEGWQYAGSRLGILPVVDELERIREVADDLEVKYQAKVKLLDLRTNQVIGTGFAICSNKESGKKFYQEFAIASMAQTRAIGKAYRNILAWIIRAAGYEPTPVEEMDYVAVAEKPAAVASAPQPEGKVEAPVADQTVDFKPNVGTPVTINQKTQILLLLNNSVITKEEKERMVAKINTFDLERADQAIAKLKKVIKERTASSGMAA